MSNFDNNEGLNLPKSTLSEFFTDVRGKLFLLTGLVPYEDYGLTLEEVRKPMLVIGQPGIGKTCGIISAIKDLNRQLPPEKKLGFKKILLGQTVVGSLSGIPVVGKDGSVQRVQVPDLPLAERDGEYGVLFLDEITTADEMQIQPALGLADDSRSIGEYTLPEHWVVIGAGNGPDCTNFVRLDDMTITRFLAYDISYDYKKDFRPYAHETGIYEDIIAFLNFNPDICVRVESTDMDEAGKMFPCPRTWERLSVELKMRQATGKPVGYDSITNFAGRIVGVKAGREFGAFLQFRKNLGYDVNKILTGTERDPEAGMARETFHIVLEAVFKILKSELVAVPDIEERMAEVSEAMDDATLFSRLVADLPPVVEHCVNAIQWFMKMIELDCKINVMFSLSDLPHLSQLIFDNAFLYFCPEIDKFMEENAELLNEEMSNLRDMQM